MKYFEKIDDRERIIFVKTRGVITSQDLGPRASHTRVKASRLNYYLLFDFTESEICVSIVDLYHWFSDHHDKIDVSLKYIPFAILFHEMNEELLRNAETILGNRGGTVQLFREECSALEWLRNQRRRCRRVS